MRRVVISDEHEGNFVTKGTYMSHGGGASAQGSGEGTRDFNFAGSKCGCKTVQGSVAGITMKLNKSYYFFLFVRTLENYLYKFFLDPNAV